MITHESSQEFQCAISNEKHFLIDPILLFNCGHCVCKTCIQDGEVTSINCSICGIITTMDFSKIQIIKGLKMALQLSFGSIFEIIEKETSSKFSRLKSNQIDLNLNTNYDFM